MKSSVAGNENTGRGINRNPAKAIHERRARAVFLFSQRHSADIRILFV
jgi:hypothetical protein